jgi:uncharacterized protein YfaP (DUF2135 family)
MRGNKGVIGLALIAALALMVATVGASASASGGSAVAAKKKCKKKKAQSAKKKKCKKKGTTTALISKVRATLTWTGGGDNTDYDLYVFDPSGGTGRAVSNPISNSSFTPNVIGSSGTETFTDGNFGARRAFAFGVCHQDGGNDGSSFSIEYLSANGTTFTDSQAGTGDGYNARYSDSGGEPANNTFTCPA